MPFTVLQCVNKDITIINETFLGKSYNNNIDLY